jgi:hypothetical protein
MNKRSFFFLTETQGILKASEYVVVDGTFKTTEANLVLTTILGFHEGIGIPCTYLLSNSNETDTYESYYRVSAS